MGTSSESNTFHVGICMAGAISAGAYTAGVMDYILESLEHWQKAKDLLAKDVVFGPGDYQTVPKHNFLIEVIGGASAGGMTAAITAAATQMEFKPVRQSDETDPNMTAQNPLFSSWVNLTETENEDMMSQMLNTSDINSNQENANKEVRAAFNSGFIKKIADEVLDKSIESVYERPYIATDADIFTTVTNLRGFDYKITFKTTSGDRSLRMKMHRDYAFFKISENNESGVASPNVVSTNNPSPATTDLPNDGRIPVNFNAPHGLNVQILKQAAMSTGAFPVGLESRDLSRGRAYIMNNKYLNLMLSTKDTSGADYTLLPKDEPFQTLNVDGGVINNEPFEVTQSLLDDRRLNALRRNDPDAEYIAKTKAHEFDSTVIMIDPFPNDEDADVTFVPKKAWRNIVPSIISAMRGQLMMKDEQIRRAYLSDDYTRFLVMPARSAENDTDKAKSDAKLFPIACGSLGGFGGFFSKKFRTHDYFLGRRNCQKFLQEHFSAPVSAQNPVLTFGYGAGEEFWIKTDADTYLPLIPDFRVIGDDASGYVLKKPEMEPKYKYPRIKLSYLLDLKSKVQERVECILDNIQNPQDIQAAPANSFQSKIIPRLSKKSAFGSFLTKAGLFVYLGIGKFFGKKAIADSCIEIIVEDMERRDLIEVDR